MHHTHPRLRTSIKWGGAALSLVLLGAWIASAWWEGAWRSPSGLGVGAGTGMVAVFRYPPAPPIPSRVSELRAQGNGPNLLWWFDFESSARGWHVVIPLWIMVVPTIATTVFAWRRDGLGHRARVGPAVRATERAIAGDSHPAQT